MAVVVVVVTPMEKTSAGVAVESFAKHFGASA